MSSEQRRHLISRNQNGVLSVYMSFNLAGKRHLHTITWVNIVKWSNDVFWLCLLETSDILIVRSSGTHWKSLKTICVMSLKNKISNIKSVSEVSGVEYKKPDPDKICQYQDNLDKNEDAREYLKDRNIKDISIRHFKLGYDTKRNAISIPVFKNDELINIKYRLLDPDKYKYSQEKGCEVWLYNEKGIEVGKEKDALLIVEGEFDLISCWQAGIENVVSPASGKDSYGTWLELMDDIGSIWIAYDNDEPGMAAAQKLSERVGEEKSRQVIYPDGYKDANDYFKDHDKDDFKKIISEAEHFYGHRFDGLADVINDFRSSPELGKELRIMQGVKWRDDHMMIISGRTNAGKTTYVLNIAKELVDKNKPTLILPFERGIKDVGPRFMSIDMGATEVEMRQMTDAQWHKYLERIRDLPLYFAVPEKNNILETIRRAKRIFDVRVIVIDHLDYIASQAKDKFTFQSTLMHDLKEFAIENSVAFVIVHHPNKPSKFDANKRLTNDDLGGSSSISQVAETVIMIESDLEEGFMTPYVTKNKGEMSEAIFYFNKETGKIGDEFTTEEFDEIEENINDW